jgi:hypothetical protein
MFSERTLPLLVSVLVLGISVACSDSEPGDDGGSSGAGAGGGSAGKGGAGSAGTAGHAGNSGTAGSGDAGSGGDDGVAGTPGAGGSAGEGGTPGAGGDDGGSGAGGAGAPSASDTLCGVRPGGRLSGEHVLRFETAAGDVVQLERAYDMAGVGESSIYRLDAMGVRFNGEEICVGSGDALEYVNTHHNWYDEAHGEKDGIRYSLLLKWDADDTFAVNEVGGEALLPPEAVVWTGFPTFCGFSCLQPTMVAIAEIVANNTSLYPDEADEHEPLIELFNAGSDDIDLSGWALSNAFSERDRWTFPSGTLLVRGGTMVVFADGETAEGPLHASFELSAEGGEVILTAADGSTDGGFEYGPQAADQGYAFSWNAGGYVTTEATPGEPSPELE